MGLFSGKRKTVVNTSISRMIEDKDIPDMGTSALYDYLFGDSTNRNNYVRVDRSYSDYLNIAHNNSIATKLSVARKWALRNYAYGVPEGDMLDPTQVDISNLMDEYLQTQTGKPVRISYAIFQPANALHLAWQIMKDTYGYNPNTNEITSLGLINGAVTYLEDIQINYCSNTTNNLISPETVYQYGLPATYGKTNTRTEDKKRKHTDFVTDANAEHDYALIKYSYMSGSTQVTKTLTFDFLAYEWSGNPPTDGLDDNDTDNFEPEAITPVVSDGRKELDYIMVQYYSQNADLSESIGYFTYEYGSGGIPSLDNIFSVKSQLGRYYPNIYIRLEGKNLASDDLTGTDEFKSSKKLCTRLGLNYKTVSDQIHESVGSVGDVAQILITTQLHVNSKDALIQEYMYEYFYSLYNQLPDEFADTKYTSLNTDYVNGYAKVGLTAQVKDEVYESRVVFDSVGYMDEQKSIGAVGTVVATYDEQKVFSLRGTSVIRSKIPVHTFAKQLTPTTCRTITVYGLSSTQVVRGGYTTTASGNDENLILPLDDAIARMFSYADRSALYSKSLVIILNTIKVIKSKWYETGIFKAIMFVIAVVVSVFTNGAGMGIYAILYAVVQTLVIGAILNLAIKFAVDKLNLDVGAMFAVVAVVLILAGAGAQLSDAGSIMSMSASQLMQVANYAVKISSIGNQMEMANMLKAHEKYGMEIEQKLAEIKQLQEEMNPDKYLSASYLLSDSIRAPDIRVGESMNDFVTRTLSTNIGTNTTSLIANLFELTIRLPTMQETIYKIQQRGFRDGNTI